MFSAITNVIKAICAFFESICRALNLIAGVAEKNAELYYKESCFELAKKELQFQSELSAMPEAVQALAVANATVKTSTKRIAA